MSALQHIFLTGFMGSGKSTLGKKLASLLRLPFIDLDDYIETKENTSVSFIFDTYGEAAFRQKETQYLHELFALPQKTVIALGGGTICFNANLLAIKQNGLLIYLELPASVLAHRISASKKKRPLLNNLAGNELLEFIQQRLEQRQSFYTQAHITVNGLNLTPQLLQQAILENTP